MKKIFVMILAVSAGLASCTSPYYPEYHPIVSLGAETSSVVLENVEDYCKLAVISNVEYDATIISGSEWLSFADTKGVVRTGSGNEHVEFKHLQNNNNKRVARLVLSAGQRRDTIKFKQKGRFEDYLTVHDDDKELFSMENGTRMPVAWEGGEMRFRLRTSCMDYELSAWSADQTIVNGFKFENGVCSFQVAANDELQPRIVTFRISYVDGWEDVKTLELSIRQEYNPDLAGDND
ncbi:MAG: BACON domain-containing protein [Alistipes sp.]|nr:BACON domain-containing protein [Alistipes sp.]